MMIDDLVASLSDDINNGAYQLQVSVDKNFDNIQAIKSEHGFTYKTVWRLLNEKLKKDLSYGYFTRMIYRARLKRLNKNTCHNDIVGVTHALVDDLEVIENSQDKEDVIERWYQETNVSLTSRQIKDLESLNIDMDKFKTLNIRTPLQVNRYITELETTQQYRDN